MKRYEIYQAPMDGLTLLITVGVSVACMGFPIYFYQEAQHLTLGTKLLCLSPIALLLGVALFAIKSYHLEDGVLCIQRLLWTTRILLKPVASVEFFPEAMSKSWRLFGNGGWFGWIGWYKNKRLGTYRAWVTDGAKTVVIKAGGKTYVISPLNPEKFVQAMQPLKA